MNELYRKNSKKKHINRIIFIIGLIVFSFTFILTGVIISIFINLQKELPSMTDLMLYNVPSATIVYDDNNNIIDEFFIERRIPIKLRELHPYTINAVIALEDQQFRKHWGINVGRTLVVLLKDIFMMKKAAGASTITQQLARNMFLGMEKTWSRKIKEALITLKIEKNFSKDEILEMYFNQINYGNGNYGIEAASNYYFGKSSRELTLAESALLAGIPQRPEANNPKDNYNRAKARQLVCLKNMLKEKMISKEEYEEAIAESIVVVTNNNKSNFARYFIEEVRKEVIKRFGMNTLYKGGLKIYTSLNSDMQRHAEEVFESKIKSYEKMYYLKNTKEKYEKNLLQIKDTLANRETDYLQGGFLLLDNKTGEVKVLIGGRDFYHSQFNRAYQARRQPGSIFKIFLFSAAVENGMFPGDIIMDTPVVLDDGSDQKYKPRNYDGNFLGPIPLRTALALSRNVTAIRLIKNIGPETVIKHARKLGVTSPLTPVLSIALGSNDVTLLEMVRAFSVFPNKGIYREVSLIRYIEDAQGNIIYTNDHPEKKVMEEDDAYIITDMLESVVREGTAAGLKYYKMNVHVGGKTGTTDDYSNAWFIGFTKDYTAGVYVGYDKPKTIANKVTGAVVALPIWAEIMKPFVSYKDSTAFDIPKNIVYVNVCKETGMRAAKYCKYTRMEIYKKGKEPTKYCEKHSTEYKPLQDFDVYKDLEQTEF
ncbi:MAG: PBP1A family penicillin-binding protein [candidate division WOR-3 bacterium]